MSVHNSKGRNWAKQAKKVKNAAAEEDKDTPSCQEFVWLILLRLLQPWRQKQNPGRLTPSDFNCSLSQEPETEHRIPFLQLP